MSCVIHGMIEGTRDWESVSCETIFAASRVKYVVSLEISNCMCVLGDNVRLKLEWSTVKRSTMSFVRDWLHCIANRLSLRGKCWYREDSKTAYLWSDDVCFTLIDPRSLTLPWNRTWIEQTHGSNQSSTLHSAYNTRHSRAFILHDGLTDPRLSV